jgi:hypothetical protein
MNALDVCDALHRRYNKPSQGREGEQYVVIEQARAGAGFDGNNGSCDLLAVNTWKSRGIELIGHEVKVSISDWKVELAQPEKAERFARFCRRWYVAAPSDLAAKIKHEIPPAWGLLSVSEKGVCREVIAAPARQPQDVPVWWWIGWLAQIDRQHKRNAARRVEQGMAEAREKMAERVQQEVDARRERADRRDATLRENAAKLKAAVGLDVEHLWDGNLDRLRQAWALVQNGYDLDALVKTLRRTADALDGLTEHATEVA